MPSYVARPHVLTDEFVAGYLGDSFGLFPFVHGDPLANQFDGPFLVRLIRKEVTHISGFPFGIESRDPDIPSCWHSATMRRSCCWSIPCHNQANPLPTNDIPASDIPQRFQCPAMLGDGGVGNRKVRYRSARIPSPPSRGGGDAPALADTIAGRVDLQIGGSAMLEQIRSGQVRGLAVTTAKRSKLAPELPTVAEAGVPDFDVTGWFAFFVPARTSRGIVEKIHIDTVTALSDPTVKAKLENVGMVAIGSTPEELAILLRAETEKWSAVIKEANIALD